MPILSSSDELTEYCLTKLGSPVINIEVDSEQTDARIQDALDYFFERHHAGYDEVFIKKVVSHNDVKNGYVKFDNKVDAIVEVLASSDTSGERMFDLDWQFQATAYEDSLAMTGSVVDFYMSMSHLALIKDMMTTEKAFTYNPVSLMFVPRWDFTSVGSGNLIQETLDLYITTNSPVITIDNVVDKFGNQKSHSVSSTLSGPTTLSTTISSNGSYIAAGTRTLVNNFRSDNVIGDVVITANDSKGNLIGTNTVTVTDRWQESVLELNNNNTHVDDIVIEYSYVSTNGNEILEMSSPFLYYNNFIVVRAYRTLNPAESVEVYNDRWIKSYSTALIKQQWGSNLKKYSGVKLPGDMEMNGQQIYDEATDEIAKLEEVFADTYELPTDMFWG